MQTEGRLRLYTDSDAKVSEELSQRKIQRGAVSLHQPSKNERDQKQRIITEPNKSYNLMSGKPSTRPKKAEGKRSIQRRQSSKELISNKDEKMSLKECTRRFSIPASDEYDDILAPTLPPNRVASNKKDDLYEEIIDDVRYQNLGTMRTQAPQLPHRNRSKVILEKPATQPIPIDRPRSAFLQSSQEHGSASLSPDMFVQERRTTKARSASPTDRGSESEHTYN